MHPDICNLPNDPTMPPFSPRPPIYDPAASAAQLLDSLAVFYRQEMMWVYRTRATLERADRTILSGEATDSQSPSSTIVVDEIPEDVVVKVEPDATPPATTPPSRWHQRKHKLKLRLPPVRKLKRAMEYGVSDPGMRVLELFEGMMETRMESCHRMNRLVRRAKLYEQVPY